MNNINDNHHENNYLNRNRLLFFLLIGLSVLSVGLGANLIRKQDELSQQQAMIHAQYSRAFFETVDYVRDINALLVKSVLVTSPDQMATVSAEIFRQAMSAKANMGQLPINDVNLDNTSKFLSQAGDYAYALSRKMANDEPITTDEYKQLADLSRYSETLSKSLLEIQQKIYAGEVSFGQLAKATGQNENTQTQAAFASNLEEVEQEFTDYPTLIYDGPFSDHINRLEPKMAPHGQDIGREAAKEKVIAFLGSAKSQNMKFDGEQNGTIPCYRFVTYPSGNEDHSINLSITKSGGHVLMSLEQREIQEAVLDLNAATQKAEEFLLSHGYTNMKASYYEKANGIATLNFAYLQGDTIIYPDLVKVKIALDNGDVIGFEAQGYLMAHQDNRQLPAIGVSEEQARAKISNELEISKTQLALIDTTSYREVLCYEFSGSFAGKNFLVYVNATDGTPEKILILLESDEGVLTI